MCKQFQDKIKADLKNKEKCKLITDACDGLDAQNLYIYQFSKYKELEKRFSDLANKNADPKEVKDSCTTYLWEQKLMERMDRNLKNLKQQRSEASEEEQ